MLTAEEIVPASFFERSDRKADIPHFLVESVSPAPAALPLAVAMAAYPADEGDVASFLALSDSQDASGMAGRPQEEGTMIRACDMMAVTLSRLIRDGETVFHGVSSHLPMVALLLAKRLHAPCASISISQAAWIPSAPV